jgi:D-glycero-D-manno-heptose 1,7-bisphosphate phosphatase
MTVAKKAAFLDRDEVLNIDEGFTHKPEDLRWIDGAKEAILWLKDHDYWVFVITNQGGIARDYFPLEAMHLFHQTMQAELKPLGVQIDDFAYCPHHPEGSLPPYNKACHCRKPEPGMLEDLCKRWPVQKEGSFVVGDKLSDIGCAERFGIPGYLFSGGNLEHFIKEKLK